MHFLKAELCVAAKQFPHVKQRKMNTVNEAFPILTEILSQKPLLANLMLEI